MKDRDMELLRIVNAAQGRAHLNRLLCAMVVVGAAILAFGIAFAPWIESNGVCGR